MAKAATKKTYDVPMIRDFLEQLTWEVRIRLFEDTAMRGTVNTELLEQVRPYQTKYGTALLPGTVFVTEGLTAAEVVEAEADFRAVSRVKHAQELAALESLSGLFGSAFRVIENEIPAPDIHVSARQWLQKKRDDESSESAGD
jgi:hypothetical protein